MEIIIWGTVEGVEKRKFGILIVIGGLLCEKEVKFNICDFKVSNKGKLEEVGKFLFSIMN